MIYLGGAMSSRMERYYSGKSKTTKRSEKNSLLYRQMDDLLIGSSEVDKEEALATTRIERLFKSYDDYKYQEREKKYYPKTEQRTFIDDEEEIYHMLKTMNETTSQRVEKTRCPRGITDKEDRKIKELISTITTTSRLSKLYPSLSKHSENTYSSVDSQIIKPKKSIDSLLEEAKYLVQKKRNEFKLKEMDLLLHPYDDVSREEICKRNLKIKYGAGAAFIVISFLILLLLIKSIG